MMKQGLLLLLWNTTCLQPPSLSFPLSSASFVRICRRRSSSLTNSATLDSVNNEQLTARERRQLRNERRETKTYNWKEEVEERLLKKPKKRYASWTEELNLDNLALLGPEWWVVRVSRVSGQETANQLARSLARNFPENDFQVYLPAVHVKRKLKNGSYSNKSNPLFPGCVFLRCILNKEIHDFIREFNGVGGFLGSKVGNTKRQINKPKPVPIDEMEAIFRQAKEEQKTSNEAFKEELRAEGIIIDGELDDIDAYLESRAVTKSTRASKSKGRTRKGLELSNSSINSLVDHNSLVPGSSVRVMSGPFAEFKGSLKELDLTTGKATVGFMLFGRESLVDVEINEIVAEATL